MLSSATACPLFFYLLMVIVGGQEMSTSQTKRLAWKKGGGGAMLEALLQPELEDRCLRKTCARPRDCCAHTSCVRVDEGESGTCLPNFYGRQFSAKGCLSDADCRSGLVCSDSGGASGLASTCQLDGPSILRKRSVLHVGCETSADCDVEHGLCCQMLRRNHNSELQPAKVCKRFAEPTSCIYSAHSGRSTQGGHFSGMREG